MQQAGLLHAAIKYGLMQMNNSGETNENNC